VKVISRSKAKMNLGTLSTRSRDLIMQIKRCKNLHTKYLWN